jgi:site-specific DNA recombinase
LSAVIYLRVSTREQAEEGYSIAAQRETCRRYADERSWIVAQEFVDGGESARTTDRPQFQRMLRLLREDRSVGFLIVHKLVRLARNLEDHSQVRAALRKAGVRLVSVTESLEESASGRLVEGILASINEFYSANLSQEIRKGQKQKAREGGWPTVAPLGYRNVRRGNNTRRGESVFGA